MENELLKVGKSLIEFIKKYNQDQKIWKEISFPMNCHGDVSHQCEKCKNEFILKNFDVPKVLYEAGRKKHIELLIRHCLLFDNNAEILESFV